MIFSLDAQNEDYVRWFLKHCSTFTVQRTNLKVPFFSEGLEQQLMAKSLGTDITITGVRNFQSRVTLEWRDFELRRA